jgi:hypothetical protein
VIEVGWLAAFVLIRGDEPVRILQAVTAPRRIVSELRASAARIRDRDHTAVRVVSVIGDAARWVRHAGAVVGVIVAVVDGLAETRVSHAGNAIERIVRQRHSRVVVARAGEIPIGIISELRRRAVGKCFLDRAPIRVVCVLDRVAHGIRLRHQVSATVVYEGGCVSSGIRSLG